MTTEHVHHGHGDVLHGGRSDRRLPQADLLLTRAAQRARYTMPFGFLPTGIVVFTARVAGSMTDTEPAS